MITEMRMIVMFMTERITMRGTVKGGPTSYSGPTHSIFNSAKNSLLIFFFFFVSKLSSQMFIL